MATPFFTNARSVVISGRLRNDGSFAMLDEGRFENGAAISQLKIIAGSGQGALKNIAGQGNYHAAKEGFFLDLDYSV